MPSIIFALSDGLFGAVSVSLPPALAVPPSLNPGPQVGQRWMQTSNRAGLLSQDLAPELGSNVFPSNWFPTLICLEPGPPKQKKKIPKTFPACHRTKILPEAHLNFASPMGSRTPQWPRPCLKANQEGGEIEAVSLPEAVQDWTQQGPTESAEPRQLAKFIFVSQTS